MNISVLSFQFVDGEPGMSFGSGSNRPLVSQTCCDINVVFFVAKNECSAGTVS